MSSRAAAVNRITPKIFLIEDHPDFRSARKRSAGATAPVMAPRQCGRVISFLPSTAATRLCRSSLRIPQRHRRRGLPRRSGPEDHRLPDIPIAGHARNFVRSAHAAQNRSVRLVKHRSTPRALGLGSPAPPARGRACCCARRGRHRVSAGSPCSARFRRTSPCRRTRMCSSSSIPPWTLLLWLAHRSATPRRRTEDRLGRQHLHCRRGRPLPWTASVPIASVTHVPPAGRSTAEGGGI